MFRTKPQVRSLLSWGARRRVFPLLLALTGALCLHAQTANDKTFESELNQLRDADYSDKAKIVEELSHSGHKGVRAVLTAFIEDRLFYRNSDQKVFVVKSADADPHVLVDPLTLKNAGTGSSDSMTEIAANNALRRTVATVLAHYLLASPDPSVRVEAVERMIKSLDDPTVRLLRDRLRIENSSKVKKAIAVDLAMAALDGGSETDRLGAISTLSGSLNSDVRNRLATLIDPTIEPDAKIRQAAIVALKKIDWWRSFYSYFETLFFGLSVGSVLVLIAIGLAITFGVMGVINMAHGELMMLGAYTTYVVQSLMPGSIGVSILVAIPVAFLVSAFAGVLMERTIIRFLYGRPLETLLATFGISLILRQTVRSIFTALNRSVITPEWMSGSMHVNGALELTYNRLDIILFTLLLFGLILLIMKRTRIGLDIRAVSQNRSMAKAMGIRTEWVDAITFGLGAGTAGVAGVALSQLTNVGPNLGESYTIDSFMVVVFGGVGNLWGSLIGGMSMGIVNQLLEPFSGAVMAKILVLVGLILFIQTRPKGLFPQAGRAAEDK